MPLETYAVWNGLKDFIFEPDLDKKTLLQSNYLGPAICLTYYIIVTHVGPSLMKNREPFQLKTVIILYNFALVAFNFHIAYGLITSMEGMFKEALCPSGTITFQTVLKQLGPFPWYFYLSKYMELLDSIFFVLRKKFHLLTVLHRLHHSLTPILFIIVSRGDLSFCVYLTGTFNSIVHVVMYFYYGLASCGPQVKKYLWWKKYLTSLQILQLGILISCFVVQPLTGCHNTNIREIIGIVCGVLFLILFINYYKRQYNKSNYEN